MTANRAIFLDRDGTLNVDTGYISRIEDLKIIDGTMTALRRFRDSGFLNIIITNQSGVSRGFFTEDELLRINHELSYRLSEDGVSLIDEIFYSPYHIDGVVERYKVDSHDRKPGTGLITKAASKRNIDLKESFFIGDSLTDMQCANNAGLKKILVATGNGMDACKKCIELNIEPDFFAKDILEASEYITRLVIEKEIKSYN